MGKQPLKDGAIEAYWLNDCLTLILLIDECFVVDAEQSNEAENFLVDEEELLDILFLCVEKLDDVLVSEVVSDLLALFRCLPNDSHTNRFSDSLLEVV